MAFLSRKFDQFSYFSIQLDNATWHGKDVLDFGGNIGNILKSPNSTIDEKRYWCIDIIHDAIEQGKVTYPKSHWIFYDRYNFCFNPRGAPGLNIPYLEQKFDYIVAYSVFTNTKQSTMIDLVLQLKNMLKQNGILAFTFIDPHFYSWPNTYNGNNLHWRLHRSGQNNCSAIIQRIKQKTEHSKWFMLVNEKDVYIERENLNEYDLDQRQSCYAYYSIDYMQTIFPGAEILPPVNDEMQHCCIIRNS